ncbi:NAD+ synthase [Rhodocaloribacter litoris]|uniref:NAD+ synthase n=1 Tax=Rhodocaloribacter litoris TaxID=2558931 RepID=UPI00141E113A|nr:NAD+ synthase [Rhodocaloribacter litoris]QXD16367.1 NAD+ synthase [Rhodocaloribacter litoris]
MKIALAQINPTVGDLPGNSRKIIDFARRARREGADLVVFPELCVTGYPPLDLLENVYFIEAAQQAVSWIAREAPPETGLIVGAPVPNPHRVGKRLFNAALLLENGETVACIHKTLLPTYDVFDEYRYFEPAPGRQAVAWRGLRLGLHICEDMWNNEEYADYHLYDVNPIDELAAQDLDLFVNISASPFSQGKHALRNAVIEGICREHGVPFVLVNQVGANTEVLFDGDSRVHAADGTRLVCAPSFREALLLWDTETRTGPCSLRHDDLADLHDALTMGIRDYFEKTRAFTKAIVSLSGGIDSAVTCALAVEALGPDRVTSVTMPSAFSSKGSVDDSLALAENLGIPCRVIPIHPAVEAFGRMLEDAFRGTEPGIAEENIQARVRGTTLMALSNKFNYLVLSTGNKSELSVGYATLYGDMSGGLAVLADVFKTQVYALAHHINERAGRTVIPENTIRKPPSAELRPGQLDTDSLPPYPVLDEILRLYIEQRLDLDAIVAATGHEPAFVHQILRMVDRNEYKRRQAPPGLRVSAKAFGIGRRLPIVMRWNRDQVAFAVQR